MFLFSKLGNAIKDKQLLQIKYNDIIMWKQGNAVCHVTWMVCLKCKRCKSLMYISLIQKSMISYLIWQKPIKLDNGKMSYYSLIFIKSTKILYLLLVLFI